MTCSRCPLQVSSVKQELSGKVLTPVNVETIKDKGHEVRHRLPLQGLYKKDQAATFCALRRNRCMLFALVRCATLHFSLS
jgi:hypothetical protein